MTFMPKFVVSSNELVEEDTSTCQSELLRIRSQSGLSRLFRMPHFTGIESVYTERLDAELQILQTKGFCDYFLIVADYVQWAKQNGIAVGPGRGSGPCSLVGFALGITNIDPIKYSLPFERFINPARDWVADFDLEFCVQRRGEVTRYIQSRYGVDRVARLSSEDATPLLSRLVICDRPLAEIIPLFPQAEPGIATANITVKQLAEKGLVQFNVIDNKALTLIQRTVQKINESGNILSIEDIDLNDNDTYRLLSTGEESSIPLLDGVQYKATLKTVQPNSFADLYAIIALCYPNLQHYVNDFAERSKNAESVNYFHPALESITAETYGLVLYQEQLMQIANKIAGFSMAQGDLFRRAIIRSNGNDLHSYQSAFSAGALKSGFSQIEADAIFEHIAIAGQRYFNKSHAIAYAMIAYQTAWLKTNFPEQFDHVKSMLNT